MLSLVTRRAFESPKCDKCVWRLGSALTPWRSYSAPPDPLATIGGGDMEEEGKEEGKGERRGKGKG